VDPRSYSGVQLISKQSYGGVRGWFIANSEGSDDSNAIPETPPIIPEMPGCNP
jgi:hypothetical protein